MEELEPGCVEFLDLSGVDEEERVWLISSLHTWNPFIELPWNKVKSDCELPHKQKPNFEMPCTNKPAHRVAALDSANHPTVYANNINGHCAFESKTDVNYDEKNREESTPRKSWASLFNNKSDEANSSNQNDVNGLSSVESDSDVETKSPAKVDVAKPDLNDPTLHRMGEFLAGYTIENHITSLQPRGLINRSNYCYINSILQAVIACPPVYNLLKGLAKDTTFTTETKKITPTIDNMVKFVREFNHLPAALRLGRRLDKHQKKEYNVVISYDNPFEPIWMHKLLNGVRTDTFVVEGRQEDAEEFLGCLLNGLNDEMLELMKLVGCYEPSNECTPVSDEDKEWQVMGPKNKGAITRCTNYRHTPISDIFGGLLCSRIHRAGDTDTDNIQPFFTLQLHIEKVSTVREALELLVTKTQLQGVTSSKTNKEVEAWEQMTLQELPLVLVLHLKCFNYKLNGCSKIIKSVAFPIDLKIDSKMLSSKTNYTAKEKQYKLFAVVYHEGKEVTKGHYITDAYHVGYASWLRYDDSTVKVVPEENVLNPQGNRVPYLLFYRRCDSFSKKDTHTREATRQL